MITQIQLDEVTVDVVHKKIKNTYLHVHPGTGRVWISAPAWMSPDAIHAFARSRLAWIRRQQARVQARERETHREYLDGESHWVWGQHYLLRVVEAQRAPGVELAGESIVLRVRPGAGTATKQAVLETWYRAQLKDALPPLLARWEARLGVRVERFFVRRMTTKWGSCNPRARTVRFSSELARKPPACLEYIVVHEMLHLLEPAHNARFHSLMDRFLPQWRSCRDQLERVPPRDQEGEHG